MKDGYYWVKMWNNWYIGELITLDVGTWWKIPGFSKKFYNKDIEIGDYIETPDKYK